MAKISIQNPVRFIDISNIDFSFDGDFWMNQKFNYLNPKCYFQKWQNSDELRLQILSDNPPTNLIFRNINTGLNVDFSAWSEVNTAIVGQTFKVYELEYQFASLPVGKYYFEFKYTDSDNNLHTMISEPQEVEQKQDKTVLIKYKNSQNDFDVIFNTNIEFQIRVESKVMVNDFKNKRNVYTDQKVNPTLLSATPYRQFIFHLGLTKGVPAWVVDKLNWIQSLDQVQYDGVYYQVPDGSEYELTKIEYNSYIAGTIDLQPTNNKFSRYQTEVPDGNQTFTPMQKVTPYKNISDNFSIANLFNAFSLFEKICIKKRSVEDLTIFVGITPGGSEIGEFEIDDVSFTQSVDFLFNSTTTVFITNILGSDCDYYVVWKQLDEPPIDLNQGSGVVIPPVGKNTVTMYEGTQAELDLDFDTSTGLGRENTNFYGWIILNGDNGGEDWRGRVPVGWNPEDSDFSDTKQIGGEKTHKLTIPEMPKHRPSFTHGYSQRGGTGTALLIDDFNQNTTKQGVEVGGDLPHNNLQPYIVTIFIKKII